MSKQQSNQTSNEFTESVCLNDRHLWSVNQTVHHSLFSVSLVIRVAIQSQGFFVFSPPSWCSSHPTQGGNNRESIVSNPNYAMQETFEVSDNSKDNKWEKPMTENRDSSNKPGWVKATRCLLRCRLRIPSVSTEKEEWAPSRQSFTNHVLDFMFLVPLLQLIYAV
jgi:hypothetical protein